MPEHITPVIYQNVKKHTAIRVEVSQFQKDVHFHITSKTPSFCTQEYPSTRTKEAWVGKKETTPTLVT